MNSSLDHHTGGASLAQALPLSLLALMDLALLKRLYAQLANAPDRWFVMRGEETFGPETFRGVLWRLARGEGPLAVLREADAEQDPAPWQTMEYQPSSANRATALAAIAGFWILAVFFGWVALSIFGPQAHLTMLTRVYFGAAFLALAWIARSGLRTKFRR